MPGDLNDVLKILNFTDPALRGRADREQWGDSPRASGTELTSQQIIKAGREALQKPGPGRNLVRLIHSVATPSAIIAAAAICGSDRPLQAWLSGPATRDLLAETDFSFPSVAAASLYAVFLTSLLQLASKEAELLALAAGFINWGICRHRL